MRARHAGRSGAGGLRWAAGGLAAAIAGAVVFAMSPATAATTVDAQLSLSGVATQSSVLGGSLVGIHPGDTVDFQSSGLPTAGLDNIPALAKLVQSLLSPLLGQFQVVVHLGSNFPGGARTVTLGGPTSGPCKGVPNLAVTFPESGTYDFTWNIQYVLPLLLGCTHNGLSDANLNVLKGAGIGINAANQWVGQVVVSDHPPTGGIGIQLPGLNLAPSLPVVGQLPTLGEPGLNVQLPVALPTLSLPGGHSSPPGGGGTSSGGDGGSTAPACVPCEVMTQVGRGGGTGVAPDANNVTQIGSGLTQPGAPASNGTIPTSAAGGASGTPRREPHVLLANNSAPAAQMPVVLAIIAIVALSLVTATYARLFLLRRNP